MDGLTNTDLPQLQSIELESRSLRGDCANSRETIKEAPYNYKNTLTMKSCEDYYLINRSSFIDQIQRKWKQLRVYRFCNSRE